MSAPELQNTIANASAAEKAIADLESHHGSAGAGAYGRNGARAGRKASGCGGTLSEAKIEFARLYASKARV